MQDTGDDIEARVVVSVHSHHYRRHELHGDIVTNESGDELREGH
jgi:hypothetical protein